MKGIVAILLAAALKSAYVAAEERIGMGCYYNKGDNKYKLIKNVPYSDKYAAWGYYNDTLHQIGWGKLHIRSKSSERTDDYGAFYCGGAIEGALTHTRISQYFRVFRNNTFSEYGTNDWPPILLDWMNANIKYTRDGVAAHNRTDVWWRSVGYAVARFDGMLAAYNDYKDAKDLKISEVELWMCQSNADMDDINQFLNRDATTGKIVEHSAQWHDLHHHCSALIRLREDFNDVYVGHNTWSPLNDLNRILKDYAFDIADSEISAHRWTFSGFASLLYSIDDLWVMDTNIVVYETSLHTWNLTLYDLYCKPESVLNWIRVQVANMLASNGRSWTQHFGRENSFTYNNQYMVIDYNKFVPGVKPQKDLVWCAEQCPGTYSVGDRTAELAQRGWLPGVNVPYYKETYEASGVPEKTRECQCDYWTYENCSRHLIMKRDVSKNVKTYEDFKKFMRYNDWQHDKYSNGDGGQSILSRYDLRPDECITQGTMKLCPSAFGGLDAKTVTFDLAKKMAFDTISSPQYETQPAWEFGTEKFKDLIWDGLPKVWKFPWTYFDPEEY